jgi:hypothetical protein
MIAGTEVTAAGAKASASMETSAAVKSSSAAVAAVLPKSRTWQQAKHDPRDDRAKHS